MSATGEPVPDDATQSSGPSAASLLPHVYEQLRSIADRRLAHLPPGQTLDATALVHEAYLKIADDRAGWRGRTLFVAAAARAMRDIVVDQVRRRLADKRGGGRRRIDMHDADIAVESGGVDVLALDELLQRLEQHDRRMAELVTLRFFGGASLEEAAETLGVSLATANRDWRYARAWLLTELRKDETATAPPHPN